MNERHYRRKVRKWCLPLFLISLWLIDCGWSPNADSGPDEATATPAVQVGNSALPPGGPLLQGVENTRTDFWVDYFRNNKRIAALMVPFMYQNQPRDEIVLHLNRRHEKQPVFGFLLMKINDAAPMRPTDKCLTATANGQKLEPRIERITGDKDYLWEVAYVAPPEVTEVRIELKKVLNFTMFFRNLDWDLTSGGCPAGKFRFDHFHRDALFASYQDPIEEAAMAGDVMVIHQHAGVYRRPMVGVRVLETLSQSRSPLDINRDLVLRATTTPLSGSVRQLGGDEPGLWEKVWEIDPAVRSLRLYVHADVRLQLVFWEGVIDWQQAQSQIREAELARASTGRRVNDSVMTAGREQPCFP